MINSPVVRGETLKFQERGVKDVIKDVFLPWLNAFRFLSQNIKQWEMVNMITELYLCYAIFLYL